MPPKTKIKSHEGPEPAGDEGDEGDDDVTFITARSDHQGRSFTTGTGAGVEDEAEDDAIHGQADFIIFDDDDEDIQKLLG